jgi:gliding motility-associated-like protein
MKTKRITRVKKLILLVLTFCASHINAQVDKVWTVENIVGSGETGGFIDAPDNALLSEILPVSQIAVDNDGNFYFFGNSFVGGSIIYKLSGTDLSIFYTETTVGLLFNGIAVDSQQNVYFTYSQLGGLGADPRSFVIWRLDQSIGAVPEAYAGILDNNFPAPNVGTDVPALGNPIGNASALKIRQHDGVELLYYSANDAIMDSGLGESYIQKIVLSEDPIYRTTHRVAGQGGYESTIDYISPADALETGISVGFGIAWDKNDNMYFGTRDHRIVKVDEDNQLSLFAGSGDIELPDFVEGMDAKLASLHLYTSGFQIIEKDGEEFMYLSDPGHNRIRKIEIDGEGGINRIYNFCGSGFEEGVSNPSGNLENNAFRVALDANIEPQDILIVDNELIITDFQKRVRRMFICDYPEINSVAFTSSDICVGDSVQLTMNGDLGDAENWIWHDGDECETNSTAEPIGVGESIKLEMTDNSLFINVSGEGNCVLSDDCFILEINTNCKEFFNTFTPNGDGKNDFFEINTVLNYPLNTVSIYNRWGELLKEIENYDNETKVWTGANEGDVAVGSGTYFFTFESGGETIISGWIELIK